MKVKPIGINDDRSRRVWYLSKGGWEHIKTILDKKGNLQNEKWENIANKHYADIEENIPHVFLPRSPLTFGHSQLVIPFPSCHSNDKNISEAIFFEIASIIVTRP